MTTADILLLLIIAGAFLIGFFWGVIRGLLALAAWIVVFVLSAHLSLPAGDYLAREWTQYNPAYDHMLAFLIVFGFLFIVTLILIQLGTHGSQNLSRFPLLDDIVGGLLAAGVTVLTVAAITAILGTFYGPAATGGGLGADWSHSLYRGLLDSTLGGQLATSLVPALTSLLGPLLPADVRQLM